MSEILGALPQLASVIEKAGTIGVLLLIICVLGWEVWRLRKLSNTVFQQRDLMRLIYVRYKSACDNANIKVDISDLEHLMREEPA